MEWQFVETNDGSSSNTTTVRVSLRRPAGNNRLESDATDSEFLEREHVSDADAVVATLDCDEQTADDTAAKRLGAERTVAVSTLASTSTCTRLSASM